MLRKQLGANKVLSDSSLMTEKERAEEESIPPAAHSTDSIFCIGRCKSTFTWHMWKERREHDRERFIPTTEVLAGARPINLTLNI